MVKLDGYLIAIKQKAHLSHALDAYRLGMTVESGRCISSLSLAHFETQYMAKKAALLGKYGSIASPSPDLAVSKWELQASARFLLSTFGINDCYRKIVPFYVDADGVQRPGRRQVDIYKSLQCEKCFYGNLVTCKSVWVCPVCASKISERRRVELTEVLEVSGYFHALVTFTLRHKITDKLEDVLKAATGALRRFKSGKVWNGRRSRWGWVGDVRSLEITHGDNGWHVHFHMVVFFDRQPDIEVLTLTLRTRWLGVVSKQGFDASWDHGLDVRTADDLIGNYVAKDMGNWSISHEVTKGTVKQGCSGGRSPRQLLLDYIGGEAQAGALFQEYGLKTKGKNQLYWSLGLRKLLGLGVVQSDGDVMDKIEASAILLGSLSAEDWVVVRKYGKRGEVLKVAEKGDWGVLMGYIQSLGSLGLDQ